MMHANGMVSLAPESVLDIMIHRLKNMYKLYKFDDWELKPSRVNGWGFMYSVHRYIHSSTLSTCYVFHRPIGCFLTGVSSNINIIWANAITVDCRALFSDRWYAVRCPWLYAYACTSNYHNAHDNMCKIGRRHQTVKWGIYRKQLLLVLTCIHPRRQALSTGFGSRSRRWRWKDGRTTWNMKQEKAGRGVTWNVHVRHTYFNQRYLTQFQCETDRSLSKSRSKKQKDPKSKIQKSNPLSTFHFPPSNRPWRRWCPSNERYARQP